MNHFTFSSKGTKARLLFSLFCLLSKIALAGAYISDPSYNGSGVDENGAYIEFHIDMSDQAGTKALGSRAYINSGQLTCDGTAIYTFYSTTSDWVSDDKSYVGGYANPGFHCKATADGSKGEDHLTLRWYLPANYVGTTHYFRISLSVGSHTWGAGKTSSSSSGNSWYVRVDFPIPDPTSFSFTPSQTVDNMTVGYTYTHTTIPDGQARNYTIRHWMDDIRDTVTDNSNENPAGSLDVAMSNSAVTHIFHTSVTGKDGYMTYTRDTRVTVPPYAWPASITTSYTGGDSSRISWHVPVPAGGSGFVRGDAFEVVRSTDPTFATSQKTVASYNYDSTKADYTVYDKLTDLAGGTEVYYRLRRTKTQSTWNWDKSVGTKLNVYVDTVQVADTVYMTTAGGSPQAVVQWEPFYGIWTSGTTFSLIKFNQTTGAQAASINLTEEQARSGQYIDKSVPYCNEFGYSIQVKLGGSYPALPEAPVPGSVLAVNIGTISNLVASKGYFPDRVNLQWNSQGQFDNYIIERKIYGDSKNDFSQISTVSGASTHSLQTTDATGQPGVYYEYMVLGAVKCNNEIRYSKDTLYAVGFRSPTGNIYGRVTYSNGQAVEGVSLRLQNNDNAQVGTSLYLNGNGAGYPVVDSLNKPFTDSALTVGVWIKPDDTAPKSQVIFSRPGQYELGFDAGGQLYFTFNDKTVSGAYVNTNKGWIHVTGIHGKDSLSLMVNDSVIAILPAAFSAPSKVSPTVYIGRNAAGDFYKGYVDEMRVWNLAETPQQIARNYTRLLTGGEHGLAAYWRFDETINNEFYDISYQSEDNDYNRNDGVMNPASAVHDNLTPDAGQLSLKDYTDSTGNYMISGIPYTGNGTSYTVVPLFQTHQFSPASGNRLISAGNASYNVNFTDNSSFPVTGTIYYYNSTIPVKDIQFMIDGKYAQAANGAILQTNDSGRFSISVPVGYHEVKAVAPHHVFQNGGKITDQFGIDLNYQSPVGPLTLYDSTTIRFIGRVAGGAREEAYPLGHSLSTNNLGTSESVTLDLPSGAKYDLYAGTKADSTTSVYHLLSPGQTDSSKRHKTRVVYFQHKIVIYPDSLTGEFEADLIPEQFIAESAEATGWGNIQDAPVQLDFTHVFLPQYSVYNYGDSSKPVVDTVVYNASHQFIKRVNPSVDVAQLSDDGQALSYFGDTAYTYQAFSGTKINIPLVDKQATGRTQYAFGNPVFTQNTAYKFEIKAFERYPFYSGVKPDGTPVPGQQDGKPVVDDVPTSDGLVSVYDNIGDAAAQPDTMSLDAAGKADYEFTAGNPVIIAPGTKSLAVSVKFGAATNVNWKWLGTAPQLEAYVLGGRLNGTNFVTAGPNKVLMVLRDPPGSNSYSYVASGSTSTKNYTYTGTFDQVGEESTMNEETVDAITWQGVGAGTITEIKSGGGANLIIKHEEHVTGSKSKTETNTFSTQFQTSADPEPIYVGANADLYVGYSTNTTYGVSDNVLVIDSSNLKSTDKVIFRPSPNSSYLIVNRKGLNFGQAFGTLFSYPQKYIQDVLIPNLMEIRNNLLLPKGSLTDTEAQQKANADKTPVYVSKLTASDPNYGKSNNDSQAFGTKANEPFFDGESYKIYFPTADVPPADTIMVLNEYVQGWKDEIKKNEQAKVNARKVQNYSFHAGSPVTYSTSTTTNYTSSQSFNVILSGSVVSEAFAQFPGVGFDFKYTESVGTQQGGSFEQGNDTTTTMGFQLASSGASEYLSVDVDSASDGGFTFRTKGGATGCPYEPAATTQYYSPGTPLDEATLPIEVPKITVDNPVVNNVPSTQKASYTLYLSNDSKISQTSIFLLYYLNTDSVKGATISVDGASIANGRVYYIPFGQTVQVVLTLTKGPNASDYNNIPIILQSNCDTSVYDQTLISAHFVPSCSNVNIETPPGNWILNTSSAVDQQGNPYLPVTLNNFDESNSLFDHIELQYKPSQNSNWITVHGFYPDSASYNAAQGQRSVITNAQAIHYNLSMDNATFNNGPYDIRALAVCRLGEGNYISTPSNIAGGIKDVSPLLLFGHTQPANGILGIGDNVGLTFDKPVAGGLLTPANFQVTGIRNGSPGDHSVSVNLDGKSNAAVSEFGKNLTGRSFTAEMWVLPNGIENGTVFSQGNINELAELAFTDDNHLQVTVGKKVIKSDKPLDYLKGQWAHVALEYNATDSTVSAFYNFQEVIHPTRVGGYDGTGPVEFGAGVGNQRNYFAGKIHGARIWTKNISATTLQLNSLTRLSGSEDALLAYYPMDEGHGNILLDKAHGNNMQFTGIWSTPPGKAVALNGKGYVKINTGTIPISSAMNYTLGLWFKGEPGQADATLLSNGKGDGNDGAGSKNLFNLGFENGLLTFENNGYRVQLDGNYLDNQWHHAAIAVNRISGLAQLFVDGQMKKYFDAQGLGGIQAPYIYAGARVWYDSLDAVTPHVDRYFTGNIDEVRIWNSYLDQSVLDNTYGSRLNGDELGLMAYYPFDTYVQFQGQPYLNFSLGDMALDSNYAAPDATVTDAQQTDASAPIKNRGPVANLNFSYVLNNNSLIINLLEPRQAIDKTIVTFRAKDVRDLNGNSLVSPVTWTAFIDQNPLKWSDDELNLSKDVYKPLQFESYIVNSGGSNEHFTLDNLPGWLTADVTTGTVPPEGKQKITFTVNEGLNVGAYNEIVYMRNDNNESEALPLNLKVNGQVPDWKVNPADFPYNMTIYGKIRVDNIFSDNPDDVLAAFKDGKCVGIAHNAYIAADDLWYVFMTIYGDSLQYNNLEFRIWDAGNGKIYEGIPSVPVSFANDAVAGAPRNPVIFDGKEMLLQNISLNEGWSWISFGLANPNLGSIPATLKDGSWQSGDVVKHDLRGFDQYSYSAGWVGVLPGFDNTSLFKLKAAVAQTLSVHGTAVDVGKIPIPLRGKQWNYIGYLPPTNMTVGDALAGYNAWDGDQIKSQTGFAMYDSKLGWVGNLKYLEPGKGYMLYRTTSTDTSFVYPTIAGILRLNGDQGIALSSGTRLNGLEIPVKNNFNYADNMTVAATAGKEFTLLAGDRIMAYAGTDLRGEAQSMENPATGGHVFFFNISGKNDQPIHFEVERNGRRVAQTGEVMSYMPNSMIGTLSEPFMLHFGRPEVQAGIYPNPFRNETTVHVALSPGIHQLQMSVYDVNGRIVALYPKETTDSKYYQAAWNGRNSSGTVCGSGIYFIHLFIDGKPHVYKVIKY